MALDGTLFKTTDPLSNYSQKVQVDRKDFIADLIFPPQPVKTAQYSKYQYDLSHKREAVVKKSTKARSGVSDWGVFKTSGLCELREHGARIDPSDERDFDVAVADLEYDAAELISSKLLMSKERDMINKIAAANFATGLSSTLGGGLEWSAAGGLPITDAKTMRAAVRAKCGSEPDTLAVSWVTLEHLRTNAQIIGRIQYTNGGPPSDEAIAKLLGFKRIIVCGATSTTANEGAAADALADMWGDFAICFVSGRQGLRQMSFGNNFTVKTGIYTKRDIVMAEGAEEGMKYMYQGWWYDMQFGAVDSAGSGKALAGYRIDNVN
ncbi:MAG: hypothetical protein JNM17_04090 [Archangium sp.]|nr:hypothetical protein [Archangium sp.]